MMGLMDSPDILLCLYGSPNKELFLLYIALIHWLLLQRESVFTARYGLGM